MCHPGRLKPYGELSVCRTRGIKESQVKPPCFTLQRLDISLYWLREDYFIFVKIRIVTQLVETARGITFLWFSEPYNI